MQGGGGSSELHLPPPSPLRRQGKLYLKTLLKYNWLLFDPRMIKAF